MHPAPPTDAPLQLVFFGECLDGHDPQAVRRAIAGVLKLDGPRTDRLFSGKRVVLRRSVDAAKAHRYVARFALLGARLHAEPMRPATAPAPEPPPRKPRRIPRPRPLGPLQWLGIGAGCVVGGLVLGLAFGPGLNALWPQPEPLPVATGPLIPRPVTEEVVEPAPAPTPTGIAPAPAARGATDAEIPPEMGAEALREYRQRYLVAPDHKAFALSAGGTIGWHAGAGSGNEARERALARCTGALRPGDDGCRIVDADGVWEE